MNIPDRLKGPLPRGHTGDALRRERDALMVKMSEIVRQTELAKRFNLSHATVHYLLKESKGQPKRKKALKYVLAEARKPLGVLGHTLQREPDAFLKWLLLQTPEGSTISETLIAIARDTHAEETDA